MKRKTAGGKPASKPPDKPIMADDDERYRTLPNGAVQDLATGRIVRGATLSRADAQRMARLSLEAKRRVVRDAANAAVQRGDLLTRHGNAAYVAEIAQAQMAIATTPDAGKAAVMAADWLMRHSGVDEPRGARAADAPAQVNALFVLPEELRGLLRGVVDMADVVDAEAGDADDNNDNNDNEYNEEENTGDGG